MERDFSFISSLSSLASTRLRPLSMQTVYRSNATVRSPARLPLKIKMPLLAPVRQSWPFVVSSKNNLPSVNPESAQPDLQIDLSRISRIVLGWAVRAFQLLPDPLAGPLDALFRQHMPTVQSHRRIRVCGLLLTNRADEDLVEGHRVWQW